MNDTPFLASTEQAGSAAFSAGVPRDQNPHADSQRDGADMLLDDRSRRELAVAWFRGWDRKRDGSLPSGSRGKSEEGAEYLK